MVYFFLGFFGTFLLILAGLGYLILISYRARSSSEPVINADTQGATGAVHPPPGAYWSSADGSAASPGREVLKASCLALLDAAAMEHPAGHGKLFARYILRSQDGDRIELLFEKGEKSRANLWLASDHAARVAQMTIARRDYPASALYQPTELGGKPAYGRHAALKSMRDLANADLVRLTIDRDEQMEMILAKLTAADQAA